MEAVLTGSINCGNQNYCIMNEGHYVNKALKLCTSGVK